MNRREFVTGAMATAAMSSAGSAQQPPAPAQGRGGGRGRGGPANVPAERLARVEIMTLNHDSILKLPWRQASPERTLDIFDLPKFYVDSYGVRNVQFQSNHVAQDQDNLDMAYIRELRAKLDAAGAKANQINIEIGTMARLNQQTGKAEALAGDDRAAWLARAKKWVDMSPTLGVTRLMHNQGALTDDSKAGVTSLWKELQDYAKPKGIMISGETRGSAAPTGGDPNGRGQGSAPAMPEEERLRYVWGILWECTQGAGGYTNLDFGGETRFHNQQELHDAIKGLLPRAAGCMHTRVCPTWDCGTAIRYAESIGYKGVYAIEVSGDSAVRIIYNTILANLT
jgi:hypothetical protein